MRLFKTVAGLRTYLASMRDKQTIALVPTMGALHKGHLSLIRRGMSEADVVVVSIFVNPLQFSPHEDLDKYPRQLETDVQLCQESGVTAVFAPSSEEMGIDKTFEPPTQVIPPPAMISSLCGPFRPGHFQGVATIVTKLLNIVSPNVAYFGEKDAQQLAIIRQVVKDLNLPVTIKGCPIIREPSGLAYSSRNQYLSEEQKKEAIALYQGLQAAKQVFMAGERQTNVLTACVTEKIISYSGITLQYVECVHPQTLQPLDSIEEAGLLAIAAYVGSTRLIDNVILRVRKPIIAIDGPAGAGKSTVTRQVAKALNLTYLDTGAMYRGIAWLVLKSGIPVEDESAIAELVSQADLEFIFPSNDQPPQIIINGENVTHAIRTPQVTALVSPISAYPVVRQKLVSYQQELGKLGGIVAEGRDIGTNVFPDADVKIFLTASVQERARRRLIDFQAQGQDNIDIQQLERDIEQRDYQDSHRTLAPLRQASDAMELNTDGLTIEDVVNKIIHLYKMNESF
ncbi:bifunctional pantothenate synthetase/cytidylate kinase [Crocosphaera subtropica ATCC 51142]|uniref:Bifunctional pantoate ligase/cytidylate kinase n=1 Tax=Crocosphaera subtropica (strain ATCC 51142 / BH68) TaxID=43989 RepID=B1X1K4_CROS5|nr:bifunctional pantoate--beta-alanine ligase/(d)CMP kinase [Crocosphaera subtropica]ACB53034.1 bifunctional pantothenate synthetase/cytidylate kinase [Crocosphaera subtropica ATCC 51142]